MTDEVEVTVSIPLDVALRAAEVISTFAPWHDNLGAVLADAIAAQHAVSTDELFAMLDYIERLKADTPLALLKRARELLIADGGAVKDYEASHSVDDAIAALGADDDDT